MLLYHYTSTEHLPLILGDGFLKTVESNISFKRPHAGPDVVWLTTDPDPADDTMGLQGADVDKLAVRITVNVDRRSVHKWLPWARARGIDPAWLKALTSAGGAGTWRVVERPIPAARFTQILNRRTGDEIPAPSVLGTVEGASQLTHHAIGAP